MMLVRKLRLRGLKGGLVLAGLVFAFDFVAFSKAAQARVFVGFGFGVPFYYPPPVVYAPPRIVYAEPPVAYASPAPQSWYYCDAAKGYYPYVGSCPGGWRAVPATPTPASPQGPGQ